MYLGIDIGGTTIKCGLVDEFGAIQKKSVIPTSSKKDKFINSLSEIIELYSDETILGIGISAPGIIKKNGMMTTAGAIHCLYGVNLIEELSKNTSLPIEIINDANAVAIAEKWLGNAQSFHNYLCVVLGTGIGGGIVINNQLFRGAHGMAGEFGWMLLDRIPEEDIETVSYNQRAAIVGGLCNQYNLHKASGLEIQREKVITDALVIMNRAQSGERLAQQVLSQFYTDLSVGLLNLMCNFDPEVILIGGGISENHQFLKNLENRLTKLMKKHKSFHCLENVINIPIMPTKLKNDAGMIGAVYHLKQELLRTKVD